MSKTIHTKEYKLLLQRLKKARIGSGLTQQQIANKLDEHQSYISKIESGERRLDVVELNKFAKIYKKNLNFFIK